MLGATRLATRGVLGVRKLANVVVTTQIGLFQQPERAFAGSCGVIAYSAVFSSLLHLATTHMATPTMPITAPTKAQITPNPASHHTFMVSPPCMLTAMVLNALYRYLPRPLGYYY